MTAFTFNSYIPYIINSYNNKKQVQIYIPMNGAILKIDVNSQPNQNSAINYARSKVILYLSTLRRIGIVGSGTTFPITTIESKNSILKMLNSETEYLYKINTNLNYK